MDLERHLDRLSALLDAEREEERVRFAEARGRLSLAEREARGLAVAEAEAVEEGALGGRALVHFARPGGRPLGAARIGAGSLVAVRPRREPRDDAPVAVVARRARARLALAFDER